MKRKAPKNQRPYSSPSGKKPKLARVTDMALANLILNSQDDIGTPHCYLHDNEVYVEVNELRKFTGSRVTSSAEQT